MKNVIVGTAGHVDHGKTCLIKALSGIDTDRLAQEKKRGITIELGFANLPNDAGLHIGIIDVPGHEKFVRNMLAGIGGIDLVLLVIALDEGVMPQTVEHFEILKMLQMKKGIIVLTKSDLVDQEWKELVYSDVEDLVEGTFLEGAPVIEVSSYTGAGIEDLRKLIIEESGKVGKRREERSLFRLPIDRVFTMEGHGTVITGTLLEGSCKVGDEVQIYPGTQMVKIRGIESHGEKEETAYAGQRTAINLANIAKDQIERGDVLGFAHSMTNTTLIDVKIQLFKSSKRRLKNGNRVHLNLGASQMIGKIILLDKDTLLPGEEAYAQVRLDKEIAVKKNDKFIIRFYSPIETFGGGIVLDANAKKHKRHSEDVVQDLQIKELGTDIEVVELIIEEDSRTFPTVEQVAIKLGYTKQEVENLVETLVDQKKVITLADGSLIHRTYYKWIESYVLQKMKDFHEENPILMGMELEEFRSRLGEKLHIDDIKKRDRLIALLVKRKQLTISETTIADAGFTANYSDELRHMNEDICKIYKEAATQPPNIKEVLAQFKDDKSAKLVVEDLEKQGFLVKIEYPYFMEASAWNHALEVLEVCEKETGYILLGDYRDRLGTSRKYAVMLLEIFDKRRITRKSGDERTLIKGR